jgi:hypothetical protein
MTTSVSLGFYGTVSRPVTSTALLVHVLHEDAPPHVEITSVQDKIV